MDRTRRFRALGGLAVAALVVLWLGASGLHAQNTDWYKLYTDGVKAFNAGDLPTAERRLLDAIERGPKTRGLRVLYYGQYRDEFLPEYYLARLYTTQHNFAAALNFAQQAAVYIGTSDKTRTPILTAARSEAEKGMATGSAAAPSAVTADARPAASPAARGTTPASTAPADTAASSQREFERLMTEATRFRADGNIAGARQDASSARALGVGNARADDFVRTLDIDDLAAQLRQQVTARSWSKASTTVDSLARLDAKNAAVASSRPAIARGLAADQERAGISAFFQGNYSQALSALAQVPADLASPRAIFYSACSTAALGLLERGQSGDEQLKKARTLFARTQASRATFAPDRKFISPRILQVLDTTAP